MTSVHAGLNAKKVIIKSVLSSNYVPSDTAKVEFYSYTKRQITTFDPNTQSKSNTLITACQGSTVLLKAPKFGKNAQYKWNGPSGFTSYSSEIVIDQIDTNYQGYYEVIVSDADRSIKGIIQLVVKESPQLSLAQTIFSSQQNLTLVAKDLGKNTNYYWLTADDLAIASTREIYLSPHPAGRYKYKLTIEKDGCTAEDTFDIFVKD